MVMEMMRCASSPAPRESFPGAIEGAFHMPTLTFFSAEVARDLTEFTVEVPSWGYGNSGTRFKVFGTPGTPRDPFEKLTDAAQTHAYTGSSPPVSLHYPCDRLEDFGELRRYADDLGLQIGMINSNTFQEDERSEEHTSELQ